MTNLAWLLWLVEGLVAVVVVFGPRTWSMLFTSKKPACLAKPCLKPLVLFWGLAPFLGFCGWFHFGPPFWVKLWVSPFFPPGRPLSISFSHHHPHSPLYLILLHCVLLNHLLLLPGGVWFCLPAGCSLVGHRTSVDRCLFGICCVGAQNPRRLVTRFSFWLVHLIPLYIRFFSPTD
jgi:hypothetical protein